MNNQKVKRGRGRPRVLTDDQRRKNKTKCMLNKEWYCYVCDNGKNYTLAGKWCHLKTKKHASNLHSDMMIERQIEILTGDGSACRDEAIRVINDNYDIMDRIIESDLKRRRDECDPFYIPDPYSDVD